MIRHWGVFEARIKKLGHELPTRFRDDENGTNHATSHN
jgi:hypothetical protein